MNLISNLARKLRRNNGVCRSVSIQTVVVDGCYVFDAHFFDNGRVVAHMRFTSHVVADTASWKFENEGARALRNWIKGRHDAVDLMPWFAYRPAMEALYGSLIGLCVAGLAYFAVKLAADLIERLS